MPADRRQQYRQAAVSEGRGEFGDDPIHGSGKPVSHNDTRPKAGVAHRSVQKPSAIAVPTRGEPNPFCDMAYRAHCLAPRILGRATITGICAACTTAALIEPSSVPAIPPWPWLPTTIN